MSYRLRSKNGSQYWHTINISRTYGKNHEAANNVKPHIRRRNWQAKLVVLFLNKRSHQLTNDNNVNEQVFYVQETAALNKSKRNTHCYKNMLPVNKCVKSYIMNYNYTLQHQSITSIARAVQLDKSDGRTTWFVDSPDVTGSVPTLQSDAVTQRDSRMTRVSPRDYTRHYGDLAVVYYCMSLMPTSCLVNATVFTLNLPENRHSVSYYTLILILQPRLKSDYAFSNNADRYIVALASETECKNNFSTVPNCFKLQPTNCSCTASAHGEYHGTQW